MDDLESESDRLRLEVFIITKFADDTKGQKEIKSEDDKRKMQEALNTLWRWAENGAYRSTWKSAKSCMSAGTILNMNIK
jgi:hypothetical protein